MHSFSYAALSSDNSYVKGLIKERSRKRAIAKLESEGLLIINIKEETGRGWNKMLNWSTISRLDKIYFTRHLHAFMEAGIALNEAIKICVEQITNKKFKAILQDIYEKINGGQNLHQSLQPHNKCFSSYFVKLIKVGEQSGRLDATLKHLLEQQEKEYDLITKIRGALIYPIILILAAVSMIIFMMIFVVPTIAGLLTEYGSDLPITTKILVGASNFFVQYGIFFIPVIILLIIFIPKLLKTKKGKWYFEELLFRLPIIKKIVIEYNIARFTISMSAPLLSGLAINKSLELAAETCQNSHYRETINKGLKFVYKGIPLSEVLHGYPRLYSPNVVRMIEIGEKTGKFDQMFARLAVFYEKSVFNTFNNLSSVIEPFLLLTIGFIVGFIAVSILTPIWKFTETI